MLKIKPCHLDRKSIEQIARKARRFFNYKGINDLDRILKKLNGKQEYFDNTSSVVVFGKNKFVYKVPSCTGRLADSYFKALAIGHYLLHHIVDDRVGTIFEDKNSRNNLLMKDEAHIFAAEFTTPEKAFKRQEKIVSYQSAWVRLKTSPRLYAVKALLIENET